MAPISRTEGRWGTVAVEVTKQDLPESVTYGLADLVTPVPALSWQADALIRRDKGPGLKRSRSLATA